jgi:hypothetical protein
MSWIPGPNSPRASIASALNDVVLHKYAVNRETLLASIAASCYEINPGPLTFEVPWRLHGLRGCKRKKL